MDQTPPHSDLKRRDNPSLPDSDVSRPNKRVLSSSEASIPVPVEQKDQNLLLFQNRAMKIRVEEQKLEINDREQKIKGLSNKLHIYEETVSCLCRVWDQLNTGLHILLGRVNFDSNMIDELIPKGYSSESFQFLRKYITEPHPVEDGFSIEQNLQKKIYKTQHIFTKISEAIEREHILSNAVIRLLKSSKDGLKSNDIDNLLKDDNDKLSKQNQFIQNIYDKLQIQHKQLSDQQSLLTEQTVTYQNNIKDLKLELEKSNDDLIIERKRVIKLKDETLRAVPTVKVPSPALSSSTVSNGSSSNLNNSNNNNSNNNNNNNNSSNNSINVGGNNIILKPGDNYILNGATHNGVIITEEYLNELSKQAESRLNEARKLREEKANLLKELQQLQIDIRIIPEERILNSMPYQILRQRLQLVSDELDIHRNQCNKLQNDLTQFNISRRLDREALEAFELQRRQSLERRVSQLEGESVELKSEKEKLINLIEQRNPTISQEYVAESRMLLDTKDSDIKKLRTEVEQLKADIEKYKAPKQEIEKAKEFVQRDIHSKNIEIKELLDKLKTINLQNEELKLNEKKLIEREKELLINLEHLKDNNNNSNNNNNETTTTTTTNNNNENKEEEEKEKVKVKDKEEIIVELKISESKLKDELVELKSKLTELEQGKDKYQSEIDNISNQFKEKIKQLDITIAASLAIQESQKQEIEALIMEIDSMGKAYENMQEQNTRLIKQISDKEDNHAHLMAENIKAQQTIRLSKEAQLAMEDKLSRNEEKLKAQSELMQKIEEKSTLLQKQLSKVTEDLQFCNFELEKHKRFVRENSAHSLELKTQLDHLGILNVELKKKADDSIFALEREIDKAKRLDEEKQLLKRKLEKASSNASSNSSTAEEELRLVNQKLRCSICNDRQKNTVIAKCFHVFCKECIYSNIDTRKRRCPGCKRPFSESDVHPIYLDYV